VELQELTPVLTAPGPFVTVHLASESDVEQAADRYDLVWKNVLRELGDRGVDAQTLAAVADAKGRHDEGASRLVVASTADREVKLAVSLPTPPRQPVVDVAPLPHLLPLVSEIAARVPHVLLVADRTGADLSAYYDSDTVAGEVTVTGRTTKDRSPAQGSWKHIYHEFPAEQGWMTRLAKDVAEGVSDLAQQIDAELVIGAGDVRALSAVQEHLATELQPTWRVVEGGRGQDGSDDLIRQRVQDVLAQHLAVKNLDLLEEYAQERGQLKRACDGVEDVVAALRKAQVQTLLVTTQAPADGTLWFGPEPAAIATTAAELTDLGVTEPAQGPLVDVLVRAAVGTGADVQIAPHQLDDAPRGGVGALLRYSDSDTAINSVAAG
jgi:Bacterial archaeo-eukaryotic release factor family 2